MRRQWRTDGCLHKESFLIFQYTVSEQGTYLQSLGNVRHHACMRMMKSYVLAAIFHCVASSKRWPMQYRYSFCTQGAFHWECCHFITLFPICQSLRIVTSHEGEKLPTRQIVAVIEISDTTPKTNTLFLYLI